MQAKRVIELLYTASKNGVESLAGNNATRFESTAMLTDAEALHLLNVLKYFVDTATINFPGPTESIQHELKTEDGRESFLVDVNRKGRIELTKCTFLNRYQVSEILLRLDINGPTHENPDGEEVPCPHLHIYREGYADKWAFPIEPDKYGDPTDLVRTFRDFLRYCNVMNTPAIQRPL
jgi:hypothetical protein